MIYNTQYNITPNHFSLCNQWVTKDEAAQHGFDPDYFDNKGVNQFVVDASTGDRYVTDSPTLVRAKCVMIFAGSFVFHPIAASLNILNMVWNILSGNSKDVAGDIERICLTPFVLLGMLFATAYGAIINPYDGRKLYGTLERFYYHSSVIATCFQPSKAGYERVGQCNCLYA